MRARDHLNLPFEFLGIGEEVTGGSHVQSARLAEQRTVDTACHIITLWPCVIKAMPRVFTKKKVNCPGSSLLEWEVDYCQKRLTLIIKSQVIEENTKTRSSTASPEETR